METINKYLKKDRIDNYPGNAVYAAMIENLDNSVGRIVEKLNKSGLTENPFKSANLRAKYWALS